MEEMLWCKSCEQEKTCREFAWSGRYRMKRCRECHDVLVRNRETEASGKRSCVLCLKLKSLDHFRVVNGKNYVHQCKACEQKKMDRYRRTARGLAMMRAARDRENEKRRRKSATGA